SVGICIGSLAVNLAYFTSKTDLRAAFTNAIVTAVGAAVEAVCAWWLITRSPDLADGDYFSRYPKTITFIKRTFLASAIGPFFGVTVACVTGQLPWENCVNASLIWWGSDFVGMLLTAPLLLTALQKPNAWALQTTLRNLAFHSLLLLGGVISFFFV